MIKVYQCADEGFGRIILNQALQKDYPKLDKSLDYFHFDANFDSLDALVSEASMPSFSGEDKVFLLTGCDFLSKLKRKGGPTKEDIKKFVDYLKKPEPSSSIYILVEGKVLRGEVLNALKKGATFFDVSAPSDSDYVSYAQRIAKEQEKTIDRNACLLIKDRVGGDFRTFVNTVRLLLEYSDDVRDEDVKKLVKEPLQSNVFGLTDFLLHGQTKKALSLYRDLVDGGSLPLSLLPVLISQFRFLFEVCYLKNKRMNQYAIADELGVKAGRVGFALDKIGRIHPSSFLKMMADLSLIEKDIKFELDDPDNRLELYILSLNQYLH